MTVAGDRISDHVLNIICREAGGLEPTEVRQWFALGWIKNYNVSEDAQFISIATRRAVLVQEVRHTLGVSEESVDIVLQLIEKLKIETQQRACLNAAIEASANTDAENIRLLAARIYRDRMASPPNQD